MHTAMTKPSMAESRRFRMLMRCKRLRRRIGERKKRRNVEKWKISNNQIEQKFYLDMSGNRLDISLNRVCKRLN